MRVGIRTKLVALLLVVAVLPLLAALATIMIGGRQLHSEDFGLTIQTMAQAKASALADSLAKDVDRFRLALQRDRALVEVLSARTQKLGALELADRDRLWPSMPIRSALMQAVLAGEQADALRALQREDDRVAEVLIADRFGQLVVATGRTTDFYQGDERWWQLSYGNGEQGTLHVPQVGYDASTATWSIDICIPLRSDRKVVGVAKVVLDVSRWLGRRWTAVGDVPAELLLLRTDGTIIAGGDAEPMSASVEEWSGEIAALQPGWRVTDSGAIQGFCPLRLVKQIGSDMLTGQVWMVVYAASHDDATGAMGTLSFSVLIVGLLLIGSLFLAGLILVERSVVKRVRILAGATARVTEGDLAHRVTSVRDGRPLLGYDEIDALVEDFDRMIDRVQHSHEQLETTNEMKTNFIRVASHELRTPISYILATVKLLRDSRDPDRMRHAMQSMGAKAKRLEQIIASMFKLMPSDGYGEDLHCTRLSSVELLEEVYLNCFPFTEQRGQHLIIDEAPQMPGLRADRDKLLDILESLVMNAIKFTPDGGTIRCSVRQELGGYMSFSVRDQGPGIDPQDIPHIFDPFFSGGDVMKHSSGAAGFRKRGMGLGLAIVKHFAELHGGSVSVTATPDGTTFVVRIPSEGPPEQAGQVETPAQSPVGARDRPTVTVQIPPEQSDEPDGGAAAEPPEPTPDPQTPPREASADTPEPDRQAPPPEALPGETPDEEHHGSEGETYHVDGDGTP